MKPLGTDVTLQAQRSLDARESQVRLTELTGLGFRV